FFCLQAEDGIRGFHVTGVQTCALPISDRLQGPVGVGRDAARRARFAAGARGSRRAGGGRDRADDASARPDGIWLVGDPAGGRTSDPRSLARDTAAGTSALARTVPPPGAGAAGGPGTPTPDRGEDGGRAGRGWWGVAASARAGVLRGEERGGPGEGCHAAEMTPIA